MIPSPLPYKILDSSELIDGSLVDIPRFCQRNHNSTKCRDFYAVLTVEKGIVTCPYGFCAQRCSLGEEKEVIFSCLNIEKLSDRRLLRKYLKDDDFSPKLSRERYEKIKSYFSDVLNKGVDDVRVAKIAETVQTEKEALSNAMHELRNFSNQLISKAEKLSTACQRLESNTILIGKIRNDLGSNLPANISEEWFDFCGSVETDTNKIDELSSTIYALSNFISIRLDTYKFEVDAYQIVNTAQFDVNIHKKVLKAIRCLKDRASEKKVEIDLKGGSYATFHASQGLEIAIFILIENAIKYALEGSTVFVKLKEAEDSLSLQIKNIGIVPLKEEIPKLTTRGFRSTAIQSNQNYKGRGIGLFLVSQLCKAHNVKMEISLGDAKESVQGDDFRFGEFIVNLLFCPVKRTGSPRK